MIGSSQISIDPHGRHKKSSEPHKMSWRAGIHGSDPVTWDVKHTARSRGEVIEIRRVELGAAVATEHVAVQAVEEQHHEIRGATASSTAPVAAGITSAGPDMEAMVCSARRRPVSRAGAGGGAPDLPGAGLMQAAAQWQGARVRRCLIAVEATQRQPALASRMLDGVAGRRQFLLARRGDRDEARIAKGRVAL